MEKCQYKLERDLESPASPEELQTIQNACSQHDNVIYGDSAEEWFANSKTPECFLRGAIIKHIRAGRRVFHKRQEGKTELIPNDVQANVTICEGHDIYIEIEIGTDGLLSIWAHEHRPGPRLPQ